MHGTYACTLRTCLLLRRTLSYSALFYRCRIATRRSRTSLSFLSTLRAAAPVACCAPAARYPAPPLRRPQACCLAPALYTTTRASLSSPPKRWARWGPHRHVTSDHHYGLPMIFSLSVYIHQWMCPWVPWCAILGFTHLSCLHTTYIRYTLP